MLVQDVFDALQSEQNTRSKVLLIFLHHRGKFFYNHHNLTDVQKVILKKKDKSFTEQHNVDLKTVI